VTLNKNLVTRGLWTLAQCALGFVATELADVSPAYAPMVAAGLSFLKTAVADRLAASRA
jgi:hypothetical protein